MNRQRRVVRARQPQRKLAAPVVAKRFIDQAFEDRVSWVAARTLLVRVRTEGATPEVLGGIERFLERHPDPQPPAA